MTALGLDTLSDGVHATSAQWAAIVTDAGTTSPAPHLADRRRRPGGGLVLGSAAVLIRLWPGAAADVVASATAAAARPVPPSPAVRPPRDDRRAFLSFTRSLR